MDRDRASPPGSTFTRESRDRKAPTFTVCTSFPPTPTFCAWMPVVRSVPEGEFAVNSGLDQLNVSGLAIDPRNPALLYACGPNGVYKTVTGGEVQSASIVVSAVVNGASNLAGPVSDGENAAPSGAS